MRNVIAIAGDLREQGGHDLDFKVERIGKESREASVSKEEAADRRGVRLVLGGGRFPLESGGVEQRAVVDFVCDKDKTGLEGEWEPEDKYESAALSAPAEPRAWKVARGIARATEEAPKATESAGEKQLLKDGAALLFDGYGPGEGADKDVRVLKLTWRTKEACESKRDEGGDRDDGGKEDDGRGTTHWGFFTWFVVM